MQRMRVVSICLFSNTVIWIEGRSTVSTVPTVDPAKACFVGGCTACSMNGAHAPRLFTVQRHDGIGGSLLLSLPAMGFAETQGWNFGGTLGTGHAVAFNHHNQVLKNM